MNLNGIVIDFGAGDRLCYEAAQDELTSQTAEASQQDDPPEAFVPGFPQAAKNLFGGMATVAVMIIILLPLLIAMDKRSVRRREYLKSLDESDDNSDSQSENPQESDSSDK